MIQLMKDGSITINKSNLHFLLQTSVVSLAVSNGGWYWGHFAVEFWLRLPVWTMWLVWIIHFILKFGKVASYF